MKLEVGSGKHPRDGYQHLDIAGHLPHLEYVGPAWKINAPENTFKEIYARHFLEHLTPSEADATLQEWNRVLCVGGTVHIILPDLAFHCKQLFLPGKSDFIGGSNFDHALVSIYGWYKHGETWGHKWGYTKQTLVALFEKHNYRRIRLIDCRKCDLELKAEK